MVVEARKLADTISKEDYNSSNEPMLQALNSLGYDEAAQYVYGMHYADWKTAHSKKATDDQMQLYSDSKPMWAIHDKELLVTRGEKPLQPIIIIGAATEQCATTTTTTAPSSLLSNVCCQDVEERMTPMQQQQQQPAPPTPNKPSSSSHARIVPSIEPPAPPSDGLLFSLGILTVSDRAFTGVYDTGDLSGPAVAKAVTSTIVHYSSLAANNNVKITKVETAVVPDEMDAIQSKLKEWTDTLKLDLILTTGGTGFALRDVTPEATSGIVDRECPGLISFCTAECSKTQPLASLSRGTAGVRHNTLIANLPGNPKASNEIIPLFLPLAVHAMKDLQKNKV
jgi:molybdopterin adenylyltransferase